MELPTLTPEPKKTEVGSYFVANYPPFSVWSPSHLPALNKAFDTPPDNSKLGLYLHTPSFLSAAQLERVIERSKHRWTWSSAKEVTFECEPGTLKESKLQTIKNIGVTRLSLGVEHFDDEILSSNGRAHKSPEIFKAWDWIRTVGFPQVNIDLIAGMLGETED